MRDIKINDALKNFICFILMCVWLTACGFHLRGAYHVPPRLQNVSVQYKQPFDPMVAKLKRALKTSGVTLAANESQASYIFHINDISQASVLQSTSTTNQVSTYILNYTITFVVTDTTGKVILPTQSVTSSTTYILNSAEALNNYTEQPELMFGLQQDAIFQIMNRLSSRNAKKSFLDTNASSPLVGDGVQAR